MRGDAPSCLLAAVLVLVDNRDSFTFNLAQALSVLGADVRTLRADTASVEDVLALRPRRIVIGPGPGRPDAARLSLELIERARDVPVLGVCLGHQALGLAFGARIGRAPELVHGRVVAVHHTGAGLFRGLPSPVSFTRYNSLTVLEDELPACLEVLARSADGDVMSLRHRERPLYGVQFHPESILSERGLDLLANFLSADADRRVPSSVATAHPAADAALRPTSTGAGA